MPYIKELHRVNLDNIVRQVPILAIGDLNYLITSILLEHLETTSKTYTDYNSVVGVLECAKLEFYRRAVAAYEDEKISENGDVY